MTNTDEFTVTAARRARAARRNAELYSVVSDVLGVLADPNVVVDEVGAELVAATAELRDNRPVLNPRFTAEDVAARTALRMRFCDALVAAAAATCAAAAHNPLSDDERDWMLVVLVVDLGFPVDLALIWTTSTDR